MKKILCGAALAAALLLSTSACSSAPSSLVGTWGEPTATDTPSLEFTGSESSGEYAGTDGCNRVGGAYTVDGGTIDLGVMRATMMFCEGVDTWLSQARSAKLSDDGLAFYDENGSEIGTLEQH